MLVITGDDRIVNIVVSGTKLAIENLFCKLFESCFATLERCERKRLTGGGDVTYEPSCEPSCKTFKFV